MYGNYIDTNSTRVLIKNCIVTTGCDAQLAGMQTWRGDMSLSRQGTVFGGNVQRMYRSQCRITSSYAAVTICV